MFCITVVAMVTLDRVNLWPIQVYTIIVEFPTFPMGSAYPTLLYVMSLLGRKL